MTDKQGTSQQRRDAQFSRKPMADNASCPFKGPDIAIVPMRYALDRSRYDVNPEQMTPLSADGNWERLPPLQSRTYTLRQLRDGYVYVFDETEEALHEYLFNAADASLTRITGGAAREDIRTTKGESRTLLLYPRTHKLRMAFSPHQWTWRTCELMRSSGVKRASFMRELNLRDYCRQMSARHTLPLTFLSKQAVADVDPGSVTHDGRFADSAHPSTADEDGKCPQVALAADVVWTGSVEDKFSALLIALDDPLAMLEDLGMQLTADQAALDAFQLDHQHALNIAGVVEKLCGVSGEKELLPGSMLADESKKRQYIRDIEAYFEQLQIEDDATEGQDTLAYGLPERPSLILGKEIADKYGRLPDPALRKSWQDRSKWRREVDLDAARDYVDVQQAQLNSLREHIAESQSDIKALGGYIGTDPLRLFIDTTHSDSLLCLLDVLSDLLCTLSQDLGFSRWLQEEEEQSKTLLGLTRFGFSQAIKDALTHEANSLVQGISDITALAGRAGELNGFLGHDALAQKSWVKTLNEPARLTVEALVELAKGAGKAALENIQLVFFPVDSRISKGAASDNAALMLRNLLMGHVLLDHPDKLQINQDFVERHNAWKAELNKGRELYQTAQHRWLYQADRYDRRTTALLMQDIQREIKLHLLKEPLLFDYRSQRYGEVMQTKISDFFARHGQLTKEWSHQAKAWSAENGLNAAAITWGIAAVNLLNTFATYESTTRDGDVSGKDLAKVVSAAAYTGNALMAVFVETGWRGMKDLGALDEHGKYKTITQRTAAQWKGSAQPHFGKLIQGFGKRLIGLGGFAILAASVELWDIVDDYNQTSIESERTLHEVKVVTVSLMAIGGFTQVAVGLLATSGHNSYIALVMSPWFAGATLIVGIIYLFAVFALNYLKQDIVGSWLRKCTWSRYPSIKFKTPQEENLSF